LRVRARARPERRSLLKQRLAHRVVVGFDALDVGSPPVRSPCAHQDTADACAQRPQCDAGDPRRLAVYAQHASNARPSDTGSLKELRVRTSLMADSAISPPVKNRRRHRVRATRKSSPKQMFSPENAQWEAGYPWWAICEAGRIARGRCSDWLGLGRA